MKLLRIGLIISLTISAPQLVASGTKIFHVSSSQFIDQKTLSSSLRHCQTIVLGEFHYLKGIHLAQAEIIRTQVLAGQHQSTFHIAWEFLNREDNMMLRELETQLKSGQISVEDFVTQLVGTFAGNIHYYPILQELVNLDGTLLATNLSREQKRPVVESGLSALPPELIPPGFAEGGSAYYQRFVNYFQGHADPSRINNYFAAQSLTDDIMAFSIIENRRPGHLVFLLTGNFHSDYYDGVVTRLQVRAPDQQICTLHFMLEEMWKTSVIYHSEWGEIADFVIVVK